MSEPAEQIELDPPSTELEVVQDPRPKIEEPPPVRLVAVDDCYLWAPAGLERQLDEFYVGLLGFEREKLPAGEGGHELIYRAQNFRVRIEILERPGAREDYRPLGIVVASLADLVGRLSEAGVEYERQRGLMPGQDSVLLADPAGNPVIVEESRVTI
jgi:hypothetical protein